MNFNRIILKGFAAPVLTLALVLGAGSALANPGGGFQDTSKAPGGYSGPGPKISTVEQVKNMMDDSKVALQGRIIQSLGGDDYLFQDSTGSITVDIDHNKWQGQMVGPQDTVEIYGEVDKEFISRTEIDVKRIVKK